MKMLKKGVVDVLATVRCCVLKSERKKKEFSFLLLLFRIFLWPSISNFHSRSVCACIGACKSEVCWPTASILPARLTLHISNWKIFMCVYVRMLPACYSAYVKEEFYRKMFFFFFHPCAAAFFMFSVWALLENFHMWKNFIYMRNVYICRYAHLHNVY